MDNGIVVTTDASGFIYDFGHYAYPQRITLKGGQYFVEDGNILATVDENGLLYRKYELIPAKIRGKGVNYFLSDEGVITTIDRQGSVRTSESEIYKNALNYGGNYFTVSTDEEKTEVEIYVVTELGEVQKADISRFKVKEIVSFGGNYFMSNRGVLHTVSSSGVVAGKEVMRVGLLYKKGGNYFVDSSNILYTVSANGELVVPALPASLRVSSILKLGSNYFIDQAGRLFVVSKDGAVFERVIRDHDFGLAKVISL